MQAVLAWLAVIQKFCPTGCATRKENLGAQMLMNKQYSGGDIQLIKKVVLCCSSNLTFSLVLGFPAGRPIPTVVLRGWFRLHHFEMWSL
jgi:hypothetical protein